MMQPHEAYEIIEIPGYGVLYRSIPDNTTVIVRE